jgi:Kdo2-lipid IVA lauroyltransferase/acyltransferase
LLDLIASLAVLAVNRIMHVMPMRFNLWFGRALSGIFYMFSGKRKQVTYANIRAAFCREKTPEQIRQIARGVYTHAAQTFAELISMTKVDAKYVEKYISVKNFERVQEASKNPRGMILVSAHFGNWELSLVTSAVKGFPLYILARDQKMKRLNELFNKLRESKGSVVVRKGADIKRLIKVLRQGKSVGLLADQNAGVNGELLELFGRPASTAVGPYRLAQKDGAMILPAFIHRKKGPYHELVLEEIISIRENEDIIPHMEKYNRLLEKHVRQDPEQWFWMHKKWKMNPVRKIIVLDDGKKGHFKQSMAVVNEIKKYRREEGRDPANILLEVIRVRFYSRFRKAVFKAAAPFFGRRCQGKPGLLRWALDGESCERALGTYADIIISCGSSTSALNMMLKEENYARNIAILDPGALIRGKFDLVIIPRHDICRGSGGAKEKKGNVVVTELAPNLISSPQYDPENGESTEEKCCDGKVDVGVLIGGNNKYFTFSEKLVRDVLAAASGFCEKHNGRMHVTTSRRTPELAERSAENLLGSLPGGGTFVAGRRDRDPDTVEKILKKCGIIIVSGESISMVSEAVSSGKHVLVFMPEKMSGKKTKYERFVMRLADLGYVTLTEPGDIIERAGEALQKKGLIDPGEDSRNIRSKLYRLF